MIMRASIPIVPSAGGRLEHEFGLRSWLSFAIIVCIGFQQFPVVRVGGSFRLYELLALALLMVSIASRSIFRQRELWSFAFLVFSPVLSLVVFWVAWKDDISGYYERFGVLGQLRYTTWAATVVPCFYFLLCWVAFSEISRSKALFSRRELVIRWIVYSGNFIGLFALFAAFMNGVLGVQTPIQLLPEFVQNVGKISYGFRAYGFSQEPSFYVLYQGWVILLTYYYRHLFPRVLGFYFLTVAAVCLVLTMSSALIGLVGAVGLTSLMVGTVRGRMKRIAVFATLLGMALGAAYLAGYGGMLEYAFYHKLVGFFSVPTTTLDSGQFRAYTSLIGLEIFKEYPITGVGPGASIFFMHAHEYKIPIYVFGESLNPGSFPQNSYAAILAELGLIGSVCFLMFSFYIASRVLKCARQNDEALPYLVGVVFTFASLLSIAPAYSMFIWVFPAFALCVVNGLELGRRQLA